MWWDSGQVGGEAQRRGMLPQYLRRSEDHIVASLECATSGKSYL
jgi:hypothetical protein